MSLHLTIANKIWQLMYQFSLIAQFNHFAETSFNHPVLDAGEQQLGLAHLFDCDLDNFAAAVGFARQAIAGLASEEGSSYFIT